MAAISTRQSHPWLRWGLLGGVACTTLLVGYGLLRYPTILTIKDEPLVLLAMGIILAIYIGIAFYGTCARAKADPQVTQLGIGSGLLIGGLWMIEVLSGNLGDQSNFIIQLLYRGSALLVIIATLFTGIIAARQSGRIRTACLVGVWSGLINGLLTACTALLLMYLFMDVLRHNPQNLQEFQRNTQGSLDMTTFLGGDSILASMSYLLIGPILGITIGGLGGLFGKGFHLSERR